MFLICWLLLQTHETNRGYAFLVDRASRHRCGAELAKAVAARHDEGVPEHFLAHLTVELFRRGLQEQ